MTFDNTNIAHIPPIAPLHPLRLSRPIGLHFRTLAPRLLSQLSEPRLGIILAIPNPTFREI